MEEKEERNQLLDFARMELFLADMYPSVNTDAFNVASNVLELIEVFSFQKYKDIEGVNKALDLLKKLINKEILSPLTGKENEWEDASEQYGMEEGELFINKRCNAVIKKGDKVFYSKAFMFVTGNGVPTVSPESSKEITFPYVPNTDIIRLDLETGRMVN